jgi:hypothetical protein
MFKRMLGVGALAAGVVAGLSACDVNQISWANHFYVVSNVCAPAPFSSGAVTLHNGVGYIGTPGTLPGTRVDLENVQEGDLTHDGVADAAVLLNCHDTIGGNNNGSEIQVFTRDAKPVERLVAPRKYPGSSFAPYFIYNDIKIVGGALYTGVESYLPGDSHALPSATDVYRWDWNGHAFTPVDVSTTMTLGWNIGLSTRLTLPAGWVAEPLASTASIRPIVPTWCLMPHSAATPSAIDSPGCTIAFMAVPAGVASTAMSVDTPDGMLSNPEYCDPRQTQTVRLLDYQDRKLGTRPASYRDWLYSCADGSRWPVEQYVADNAPAVVLYSSHSTPAVHAVLTQIAKTAQLPAISAPLRLSDLGYVRSVTAIAGGHRITLDRVVRSPGGLINDSPQTYVYDVPAAAVPNGETLQAGDLVQVNTNGTGVTRAAITA